MNNTMKRQRGNHQNQFLNTNKDQNENKLSVVEYNEDPEESSRQIQQSKQQDNNFQINNQRKRQNNIIAAKIRMENPPTQSNEPATQPNVHINPQSLKIFAETNTNLNQQPNNPSLTENIPIKEELKYYDQIMIILFLVGFLAYIGLGLYAIKVSNPFKEIEIKYNENEKKVVQGFFSVIIAFCITFVMGLLTKPIIYKYFGVSLKLFIILSLCILYALVAYSFARHLTGLGVAAAILAFLASIVGLIYYSRIEILSQIGVMASYFDLLQMKYIVFLLVIILILFLLVAFAMIVVTHILFISDDDNSHQDAINFFAASYVFLTYWINNTIISYYCYVISRQVSKAFFKRQIQISSNTLLQSLNTNKTNRVSIQENKNSELTGEKQVSLNSGDQENNQIMNQTDRKKGTILVVSQNIQYPVNADQMANIEYGQRNNKISNSENIPLQPQIDIDYIGEPLKTSIIIGLKQFGTITYCSLVSQLVECLAFIIFVLVYGTGLVLFYSTPLNYFNESLIKLNSYISIVRMAHDEVSYCDSLRLIGQQIAKKNYYYPLAMFLSNQISQIIEFFCFIIGFSIGIVLIVHIGYNYWFITFAYILLLFCVVKNASKLSVSGITTILFSVSTYFDLMAFDKALQQKSDKFQNMCILLKKAQKLMKENNDDKELHELY